MSWIPDIQEKKKKEDSFFDYENILPQDRLEQAQEAGQPSVSEQPSVPKRTTDDIIKDIFSYRPPALTYDPNRPEELRRLARASAIGKGLNLIGDVIGMKAGALIRPRPKDEKELGYLQSMYSYIDDYNRRMDEWNWREFVQKLRQGEMALSQANLEEERKLREKMFESQEKWKELGFVSEQAWRNWQAQKAKEDQELSREKFEVDTAYKEMTAVERERHNRQMELASMLRAQAQAIRAQKPSGTTKTYTLYDSKGNPVELTENENFKIISLILEDPLSEITTEEIDLLKAKFGTPMSTNTINTLIQKYWEKTPSSRDYVYLKYGKPDQSVKQNPFDF